MRATTALGGAQHVPGAAAPVGASEGAVGSPRFQRRSRVQTDDRPTRSVSGILLGLPLFAGLLADAVRAVAARTIMRRLPKNATLFRRGEPCHGLYIVVDGRIQVHRASASGREQILHVQGPGEPVAEVPLFDGGPYPASARALEDSRLLFLPQDAFQQLYRENPEIADAVIRNLGSRLRRMVALIAKVTLKDVRARVAATLVERAEANGALRNGGRFVLARTQEELARELATTREGVARALAALRAQLQPHFLFNTLHSVSALIHEDDEAADLMIARLSDFLRLVIEHAGEQEVALVQELEFLNRYLEIQQVRFQDRLRVSIAVDPAALDAMVPNLVLQPLVENAIRHAVEPRAEGGRVEVSAARHGENLRLTVRDHGPGLRQGSRTVPGVGISNTRARLEQLYGGNQTLEIANHPQGGALVTVKFPWRVGEAASAA